MSSEWTVDALKEHFEKILDERLDSINKTDQRIDEILRGFPQNYSLKSDGDLVQKQINDIKSDHVQRREFDSLKEVQAQGRGARLALAATMGIIIALISVALGAMYANQLTHEDVSNQISREAPWLADRPTIETRIDILEKEVVSLKLQLANHEASDKIKEAINKK